MTSVLSGLDVPLRARSSMRAAMIVAPGRVELASVPMPRPAEGEVLIRLEGCGVCASNLPPWEGRPWFQYPLQPGELGHEGWGTITAVGDGVEHFKPGDRVAALANGAYAEYVKAPVDAVLRIPDDLAEVPFPGEPLGCAFNIFRRSGIHAGQTVVILGIGFLGAILTRLSAQVGARVIAVSRRSFALGVARSMGAAEVLAIEPREDLIRRVHDLTDGRLCERVIEAVGKQEALDLAGELTGERGRLIVAGYHQDGPRQVNMQLWNWRGIDVINAHERDPGIYLDGMRAAAEAVATGLLDPSPLYTHEFPLARLADALNLARERPDGFMKALVTC